MYTGHSGYVTSVCVVPGNATHPEGLVVTGSRDSTILAYSVSGGQPLYTLAGHSDTGEFQVQAKTISVLGFV